MVSYMEFYLWIIFILIILIVMIITAIRSFRMIGHDLWKLRYTVSHYIPDEVPYTPKAPNENISLIRKVLKDIHDQSKDRKYSPTEIAEFESFGKDPLKINQVDQIKLKES